MSKTVRLFILSSFIFSLVTTPVFAIGDDSRADRVQERLELLREKRNALRERLEEKREEIEARRLQTREEVATRQAQIQQRVVNRIKAVFAKILRRFNAALSRLDKIADRIASRIDKLQDKGVDTSKAEAALVDAEVLGAAAQTAIDDAAAEIEAIDSTSSTVREAVNVAKEAVRSAKNALKAYHRGLVAAIRELKASSHLREATEGATNDD